MIHLASAEEVIAALGGDHKVATKYERTVQAVRNWRYGRGIPLALRPYVDADLRRRGKTSTLGAYSSPIKVPVRKSQ